MLGAIFGIAGCTNSGKTTLRDRLKNELSSQLGCRIVSIGQDDFFKKKHQVRQLKNADNPGIIFYNYDESDAVDVEALRNELQSLRKSNDLVLLDGNMLTELPSVFNLVQTMVFVTLDYNTCKKRRVERTDYDPPDEVGYFDQVVWKAYNDHLKFAQSLKDPRLSFLDGTEPDIYARLLQLTKATLSNRISIQKEAVDVDPLCSFVNLPECGAISVFIGTTRDYYIDKKVRRLEYDCYQEMAMSELWKLCHEARQKYSSLRRIAITHRIGEVPIKEKSVVIATSAPGRAEAIQATEFLIDRLKATVPIWKKETYEDDESVWKENVESFL